MVICYFGIYNSEYSRNRILIKGLRQNGVHVIECQSKLLGIRKYFELIKKHNKIKNDYDVMVVGFPGYQATILARFLTRKKIIFDAFTSIYDSIVFDRKGCKKISIKAFYLLFLDWFSCFLADKILLDTNEHIKYFVKTFKINKNKFLRVLVGSDDCYIKPQNINIDKNFFIIHFHGSLIPLQGVDYIIKAAEILQNQKDIRFRIIGSNIKKKYEKLNIGNIDFIDNIPYGELSFWMSKANLCLGIFGDTEKTKRVIPNKVYEAIATKRPIITADTLAIREIFSDRDDILLCNAADSLSLADNILRVKNNFEFLEKISNNGYIIFKNKCTPKILAKKILANIN